MTSIGIGSKKVEAVVAWLGKTGLRNNNIRTITKLGYLVYEYDPYFESFGTMWLLHYGLSKNIDAEVWYYLTNKFLPSNSEFKYSDVIKSLQTGGIGHNQNPKRLKSDTRIYLRAFTDPKGLKEINFLVKANKDTYKKGSPHGQHPLLIAYILFDQRKENYPEVKTVSINELLTADGNVGKVCLLNRENLEKFLYQLQGMGYLVVSKFADLDQVAFKFEGNPLEILEEYYKSIK